MLIDVPLQGKDPKKALIPQFLLTLSLCANTQ